MKTVVIGMSGGVDSSVAAILLKKSGYNVIGLFMRNWDSQVNDDYLGNPNLTSDMCPQEKDYQDALKVCQKIDIPLHRIDFVEEYWQDVFTYFLDELAKGRTPNPDMLCNKFIKFDLFYQKAKSLKADYIATGHYAKIIDGKLYKAKDKKKDQSYFLSYVNPSTFKDVLFPLGDIEKTEVRKIAQDYGLVTADKKDSTGICFIGERNFTQFLQNYFPISKGPIINIDTTEVLGSHNGLMYYTIGQRKGLDLGNKHDKIHDKVFVVKKDLKNNILYVAIGEENKYLYSNRAIITNFNFLVKPLPQKCHCKFRYRQADISCSVKCLPNNQIEVLYHHAKAVTPGQFCVLYKDEQCLGGGIIDQVF